MRRTDRLPSLTQGSYVLVLVVYIRLGSLFFSPQIAGTKICCDAKA